MATSSAIGSSRSTSSAMSMSTSSKSASASWSSNSSSSSVVMSFFSPLGSGRRRVSGAAVGVVPRDSDLQTDSCGENTSFYRSIPDRIAVCFHRPGPVGLEAEPGGGGAGHARLAQVQPAHHLGYEVRRRGLPHVDHLQVELAVDQHRLGGDVPPSGEELGV